MQAPGQNRVRVQQHRERGVGQVSPDRHTTLSIAVLEPSEGERVGDTLKALRC